MLAMPLVAVVLLQAAPSYPAGVEVHWSDCASGGFDWFFYEDGSVISRCYGCETHPHVQLGTWKRDGAEVVVEIRQEWFGYGRGQRVSVASVDIWADYVAMTRIAPRGGLGLDKRFEPNSFTAEGKEGCDYATKHTRPEDAHAFLRQFDGDHPETFQRVLGPGDLQKLDAGTLRLMRNEVFARYGYKFTDAALAARFARVKGYSPLLSNVDDFLSDIERENVKRLFAAESSAKVQGPSSKQ